MYLNTLSLKEPSVFTETPQTVELLEWILGFKL